MSVNLLIISFYFPPYNKVGGRRWAKHCKYFEKEGVKFNVLAGNFDGASPWDKDVEPYKNKVSRIKIVNKKAPFHKRKLPENIIEKIVWKLSLLQWETKKKKLEGNYNDASSGYESLFYSKAKELIINNRSNIVIISTGPFTYASVMPALKKDFPDVKFVLDYRDYWEDVFTGLNNEQVKTELDKQNKVIENIDLILSPNVEMQKYYSEKFKVPSYLLPHCIDKDDLLEAYQELSDDKIRLVYGGAFYENIEENISLIKTCINELASSINVAADFYVSVKGFEKELAHPAIKRYGFIGAKEYFQKLRQADYAILILPPNRINAMSSKFFELVAFRKPILYFGNEGDVSIFIKKHNLGFHITKNNMSSQVKAIIENKRTNVIPDLKYDITNNTFEFQTKELIKELEKLCRNQN